MFLKQQALIFLTSFLRPKDADVELTCWKAQLESLKKFKKVEIFVRGGDAPPQDRPKAFNFIFEGQMP